MRGFPFLGMVVFLVSCAGTTRVMTVTRIPGSIKTKYGTRVYRGVSRSDVFRATLAFLLDWGYDFKSLDESLGLIDTDWKMVAPDAVYRSRIRVVIQSYDDSTVVYVSPYLQWRRLGEWEDAPVSVEKYRDYCEGIFREIEARLFEPLRGQ